MTAPLREELPDGVAPSRGDELMLLQILLGSWPLELAADDAVGMDEYAKRIGQWQEKAIREAKLRSTWSAPNEAYESACRGYLERLLLQQPGAALRGEIAAAAMSIAPAGALNGLSQTLLRMTAPGVPDLYQGAEFWDFSLVDPDNRRPVDFTVRSQALAHQHDTGELLANWRDGRIKQWLIGQTLQLRAELPELFTAGEYLPLEVHGEQAERVLAFARRHEGKTVVVIVPRLAFVLLEGGDNPFIDPRSWGDTYVQLPESLAIQGLRGLFCSSAVTNNEHLRLADVLATFPLGILRSEPT
ncbi:hypothetical protein [Pseudomonas sp.]|uniref:hypothetical protein n=1 Tax=Pseudomonas sp. TaxID=306 RepID=UPI0028B011A8|nr:hypothetical protein [Pseudomonas sp.]